MEDDTKGYHLVSVQVCKERNDMVFNDRLPRKGITEIIKAILTH